MYIADSIIRMSTVCVCSLRSVTSLQCSGSIPPLLPSGVDHGLASHQLETQLRALTVQHRRVSGWICTLAVCGYAWCYVCF